MSTVRERQEAEASRIRLYEEQLAAHNKKVKVDEPPLMNVLLPYSAFFINDGFSYEVKTKSRSREKQLGELARHVFAKYRVNPKLAQIWNRKLGGAQQARFGPVGTNSIISDDLALWYICAAQGGSLYKEHAKKYLTKKEVHTFLSCSHNLSIEQMLVFAIAMSFAPNVGVALRLARTKLSAFQLTDFLKTVIYFFAKNVPSSVEETNDLLDFIMARHGEIDENRPPFSMSGHTLESLRRKTKDWHYELRRIKVMGTFSWEGCAVPDEIIETKDEQNRKVRWYFIQIKSSKELAAEGSVLRHCVYGYRDRCSKGDVYIWSLSREDPTSPGWMTKKVTIELRNDGRIVQARGTANRVMKAEERHVVGIWARRNDLIVQC